MMKRQHFFLVATLVAAGLPAPGLATPPGAQVLDPSALATHSEPAVAVAAQVRIRAGNGDVAGAVAQARAALADQAMTPAARERLRFETLMALARVSPDESARGFVAESARMEPTVFMRIDESGHDIVVPAWDAPAAARFAERRWEERAARDAAIAGMGREGDLAARWLGADERARTGVLEAVSSAPDGQLPGAAASLYSALAAGQDVSVPALAVAARTADATLFVQALGLAPERAATVALRDDLAAFAPADRVTILESALGRDALASTALLGLAREAATDPAAEELIWQSLPDPRHGASAAAALARLDAPGLRPRLERLAADDHNPTTRRWAGLALQLAREGSR